MTISAARTDDLDAIVALEQTGFADHEQWSSQAWAAELTGDRWVITDLDAADRVVGVASFSAVADLADLHRVIVHPQLQGRGIGASLVRAGLEWAEAAGAGRMLLEVRPDNAAAVALYLRLGFEQVTTRRDYYGQGVDAMVMLRPLGRKDDGTVECA